MKERVTFIDQIIDFKYWDYDPPHRQYTGHSYYNSPYESCDKCGNCDGAKCDICKLQEIPARFECNIPTNELVDILVKKGVPKEVAEDFAYSDTRFFNEDYDIIWPIQEELKNTYPEFYSQLWRIDKKILRLLRDVAEKNPHIQIFGLLKEEFYKEYPNYENDNYVQILFKRWFFDICSAQHLCACFHYPNDIINIDDGDEEIIINDYQSK